MKFIWLLFLVLNTGLLVGQNAELANSYFRKGEYEKAILLYEPLFEKNPIRQDYFKALLTCYQQIDRYAEAEELLQNQLQNFPNQRYLYVEIGYNYQLRGEPDLAKQYYEKALSYVDENPSFAFVIGRSFRQNHLLDYALRTYKRAKELNPALNTEISEAQIYGEKGEIDKMFALYLDLVDKNDNYYPTAQRFIGSFISDDAEDANNVLLKKQLLKRAQSGPKDSWNILLSWLFMQQGDFDKALIQEKSLFIRNPVSLERIEELGKVAFDFGDLLTSRAAFQYLLEKNGEILVDKNTELRAEIFLLQIDNQLLKTQEDRDNLNEKYLQLNEKYGTNQSTLVLQVAYAEFLTYSYDQPIAAIAILKNALTFSPSKAELGMLEMTIADIQVFSDEFNQALILYSKIQYDFKNSPLAQEARFKVARTSYFKGDFAWAQNQLKVLKSSTSQLTANDAMKLSLKISNNFETDSLNDGLRLYAKAELLEFQKKYKEALDSIDLVLNLHKGRQIEDDALLKKGEILRQTGDYPGAEISLQTLLAEHPESLLTDDCLYLLGELYRINLNESEKAKEMYERIIFKYPSSIYLVDARKAYRTLRGDEL